MLERGPCPPGKYITHPAECKRAADELGNLWRDPLDLQLPPGHVHPSRPRHTLPLRYSRWRRGCIYGLAFAGGPGESRATGWITTKYPDSVTFNQFSGLFYFSFLLARFGGLFCFYFSIGQARFTAARHLQSKYLQMLNEEIQKENNTITDGGVAPRCSFAGPT